MALSYAQKLRVMQAMKFAADAHGNQTYGQYPYLFHLIDVLILCEDYDIHTQMLALLHDVLEDTKVTKRMLVDEFGFSMATQCVLISDEEGPNRKIRKELTHKKLKKLNESKDDELRVLIVKTADRLANMTRCILDNNRSLLNMYIKEFPEFHNAVYRDGHAEVMWSQLFNYFHQYK